MIPHFLLKNEKRNRFAVVIPFKNESFRLHGLIQKCIDLNIQSFADIILVDGGSSDDSLNDFILKNFQITCIMAIKSKGLSQQLRAGFKYCVEQNYVGVITIDANGKDDPKNIKIMIEKLENGYDFVQASRHIKGGCGINTPPLRSLAIRYIHAPLLTAFSGFRWTDSTQGYRGYSIRIFKDSQVDVFRDSFVTYELLAYMNYVLPRLNYRCVEIPVTRTYPKGAVPTKIKGWQSHWNLLSILIRACCGLYNVPQR